MDRGGHFRGSGFVGGCVELGGDGIPFAPLVEMLRELVRRTAPDELDAILGAARPEIARLLPELGSPAGTPTGTTAQFFELVLGVLVRLAERRPVVLVFEDLHWADGSTLDLVTYLTRALRGVPIVVVATYRSDEMGRRHPLRPLLSSWDRLRNVERIELARFGRAEVEEQLAAILGRRPDRDLVALIFDRSEGNAFLVEEMVRAVEDGVDADDLPPSLRDVLLTRTERLSDQAQRLLRVASASGRRVPERLLAVVSGLSDDPLYAALREAVEQAQLVIDESGRGYSFRHALVRDAIYDDMLPGERVALHTAYGEALTADPALVGDQASLAAALAQHWYAAHDLPRAISASIDAARMAEAAFAPADALRHYERALEIWPRVPDADDRAGMDIAEAMSAAARTSFQVGKFDRALSMIDQALGLVSGDDLRTALLLEQRATILLSQADNAASLEALERAAALVPREPPSTTGAAILGSLAKTLIRVADDRGEGVAREAVAAARACNARDVEASALITLGSFLVYSGEADQGLDTLREGAALANAINDPEEAIRGYINLTDALEMLGRHEESAEAASAGITLAREAGLSRTYGAFLVGNVAEALIRLGRWAEAERLLDDAVSDEELGVFTGSGRELRAELAVARGRYEEADRHIAKLRTSLGKSEDPQYTQALAAIEAWAALDRCDPERARAVTSEALALKWWPRYSWPLVWLGVRAEADIAVAARSTGNSAPPEVEDIARQLIRNAEAADSPEVLQAVACRAMARAEFARLTDSPDAPDAWVDAVAAVRGAQDAYVLAYALFRTAEATVSVDREQSATHAAAALQLCAELELAPLLADVESLVRRARLQLAASGAPSTPDAPADSFGLTTREREVLELVAAGQSNGQIAKTLFISPKTASVHVSNILMKLSAANRGQAAAIAHAAGLLTADSLPEG